MTCLLMLLGCGPSRLLRNGAGWALSWVAPVVSVERYAPGTFLQANLQQQCV